MTFLVHHSSWRVGCCWAVGETVDPRGPVAVTTATKVAAGAQWKWAHL